MVDAFIKVEMGNRNCLKFCFPWHHEPSRNWYTCISRWQFAWRYLTLSREQMMTIASKLRL